MRHEEFNFLSKKLCGRLKIRPILGLFGAMLDKIMEEKLRRGPKIREEERRRIVESQPLL